MTIDIKVKNSIRKRLTVTITCLAVIPLLVLGAVLSWESYKIQRHQKINIQREISRRVTSEIRAVVNELESELVMVTRLHDLMRAGPEQQRGILSKFRSHKSRSHKEVLNEISLLDDGGRELVRVSRSGVYNETDLRDMSGTDEFRVPSLQSEIFYSNVLISEETGEPYMIMSMPLLDPVQNRPEGVVVASIRLKYMWEIIDDIKVGNSGLVYIVDRNGRVIAHPNPSMVLKGTYFRKDRSPGIRTGLSGEKAVLAGEKMEFGNQTFHVVTELPASEAFSQTYRSLITIGGFLVFTLSGAVALGFVFIRKIIRPVESLAGTAKAISDGDLSRKTRISGNDEIGVLSDAFDTMTDRLVETITSLKKESTEHEKSKTAIQESHERLVLVLNSLDSIVYVADMNNYDILFINKYARDIFGDIEGKLCWKTLQAGQAGPCGFCSNRHLLTPEGEPAGVYKWELQNTANKRWYYIHDRAIRWVDGRLVRLEIATDITDRHEAEAKIKASLQEKELLLKEIHHRVKNNMQIISSLITLQSENIPDDRYTEMFNESRNRIRSMSLVHEQLYRSGDLARINFREYVENLADDLLAAYTMPAAKISVNIEGEWPTMGIDTAIPCGLIMNEILSNSLKHAFPGRKDGKINIMFNTGALPGSVGAYELIVRDNGIGIPENLNIRECRSLGLQLILNLSEHQLQGKLELNRRGGTEVRILFDELKYRQRI